MLDLSFICSFLGSTGAQIGSDYILGAIPEDWDLVRWLVLASLVQIKFQPGSDYFVEAILQLSQLCPVAQIVFEKPLRKVLSYVRWLRLVLCWLR